MPTNQEATRALAEKCESLEEQNQSLLVRVDELERWQHRADKIIRAFLAHGQANLRTISSFLAEPEDPDSEPDQVDGQSWTDIRGPTAEGW